MRAFVTGGTGLLRPNLIDALRMRGYEVATLVRSRQRAQRVLGDAESEGVVR